MENEKIYQVYGFANSYKISLNSLGQISCLKEGNYLADHRNCCGKDNINRKSLELAFKLLLIDQPEQFADMYHILKNNDAEMFALANKVVTQMSTFCSDLLAEE